MTYISILKIYMWRQVAKKLESRILKAKYVILDILSKTYHLYSDFKISYVPMYDKSDG